MAHHVEPMDIDSSVCDFDDKENSLHNSNVYSRTPCTEKGYEELDVTDLNMKLRYSITPTSSPMSKSLTFNCTDNKNQEPGENVINNENSNLTRSLNLNLTRNDKLPLQALLTEQYIDFNRNPLMPLDATRGVDNITVSVCGPDEHDALSLPSSSSSMTHTPDATTPTKEIKEDNASPILRGLKSVLNMFRPSQSPIPPTEEDNLKPETLSPPVVISPETGESKPQVMLASTPLAAQRTKDALAKSQSPHRESIVFNEDLETELQWKDETTILFSHEKIPIHKLFFQNSQSDHAITPKNLTEKINSEQENKLDATVEYMDISYNDSVVEPKTPEKPSRPVQYDMSVAAESDSEFVDCENTFVKEDAKITADVIPSQDEKTEQATSTASEATNILNTTMTTIENVESTTKYPTIREDVRDLKQFVDLVDKSATVEVISDNLLENHDFKTDDVINNELYKIETPITIISNSELENPDIAIEQNITLCKEPFDTTNTLQENSSHVPLLPEPVNEHNLRLQESEGKLVLESNVNESIDIISHIPIANEQVRVEDHIVLQDANVENLNEHVDSKIYVLQNNSNLVNIEPQNNSSSDPSLEMPSPDLGVSNLSKIPLLADPRVLLFNIDPNIASGENKSQIVEVVNTSPADIPLPDDDDSEKFTSIIKESHGEVPNVPLGSIDDCENEITSKDNEILPNSAEIVEEAPIIKESRGEVPNVPLGSIDDCENEITSKDNEILPNSAEIVEEAPIIKESRGEVPNVPLGSIDDCEIASVDMNEIQPNSIPTLFAPGNCKSEVIESDITILHENACDISVKPLPDLVESNEIITHNNIEQSSIPEVAFATALDTIDSEESIKEEVHHIHQDNLVEKLNNIECAELKEPIVQQNDEPKNSMIEIIQSHSQENLVTDIPKICDTNENNDVILNPTDVDKTSERVTNQCETDITATKCENAFANETTCKIDDTEKNLDEELVASNDNSPFVSVSVVELPDEKLNEDFENVIPVESSEGKFEVKTKSLVTPPSSPKIVSRGTYNFNFDEIEDPFATKTKIRMSPSPIDNSNKEITNTVKNDTTNLNKNRRKTIQPDRKKSVPSNKKFNSTFARSASSKEKKEKETLNEDVIKSNAKDVNEEITPVQEKDITETQIINDTTISLNVDNTDVSVSEIPKQTVEPLVQPPIKTLSTPDFVNIMSDASLSINVNEVETSPSNMSEKPVVEKFHATAVVGMSSSLQEETIPSSLNDVIATVAQSKDDSKTSSSEQSTYFSAGTSSNENIESKSVFNLPEIDDVDFNPFLTKSKIRQSPTPSDDTFVKFSHYESYVIPQNQKESKGDNDIYNLNETAVLDQDLLEKSPAETELEKEATDMNNTGSSKTDDENVTVRTIHTEDEDTIEGPFLEADEHDKIESENVECPEFGELPAHVNDDAGELFIDAEAFEFLLNQNTNTVADSGKESLFLKFDPLFAKRMSSEGAIAALRELQKKQSTPKRTVVATPADETFVAKSPIAVPSFDVAHIVEPVGENTDDLNVTVSKPMMVVNPAVMPSVTHRNKTITPTTPARLNRQSLTFTSPAIAVIDRLLSMSSNNSLANLDNTVAEVQREPSETDQALSQLRELLADKEISVYNLRTESKELRERLTTLESQMKSLEKISEERLKKINELNDMLNEKTNSNKRMAAVVEEYERTIASLISETEQDRKRHVAERVELMRERDEQTNHLASMEISFNDLHSKYEKSKQVIMGFKANEEVYKKSIKEFEENFAKMQKNYELLKQHATAKLNHANEELQKINRSHEAEVLKLNAMIKRKELHITSLEETLSQKTKANEELTKICDELLYKV